MTAKRRTRPPEGKPHIYYRPWSEKWAVVVTQNPSHIVTFVAATEQKAREIAKREHQGA